VSGYKLIEGVYAYFVTFSVKDWLPLFDSHQPKQIIMDSLRFCIEEKFLRIYAYVLMIDHMHLIVFDANFDNLRLQRTLTSFRKYTGKELANYIDDNLSEAMSLTIRCRSMKDRARQVWQPGWHMEGLVNEWFLEQKLEYIHDNPVRKGYVNAPEQWGYSSAGFWLREEEGILPVVRAIQEEN